MELNVCILAAGQGKRMNSRLPKVLHPVGGKPMIGHVLDTAAALTSKPPVVVFGFGGDLLRAQYAGHPIQWVEQREQLGTGHAVAQALPMLAPDALVVILYGDVPLLSHETLQRLIAGAAGGFALLTITLADPADCGRILRDPQGRIRAIVERRDASAAELAVREVNTGVMAIRGEYLHRWLPRLDNRNAQGEYYLTDCVAMAAAEGIEIQGIEAADEVEVTGVNDRAQQAALERAWQRSLASSLMQSGVTLLDPGRIDVRGDLRCGSDVTIDVNTVFEGSVTLGNGVRIGPHCVIRDAVIGEGTEVLGHCVIDNARIGAEARIGPFARIRPETALGDGVHVGNFVEVKKSSVGEGSKINHLAYVGDAEIGRAVNVGAGTITCNYDGAHKHRTVIEDEVFIGSDTQLVAPVRLGRGVTVGAGTTVTEDVEAGRLVISRVRQRTIAGYQRPRKDK